ncbi:MAG: triose-phosphate isomerase [Rickettsiales bacterium]|jgi:triosephosphate isomerase|nr:triose-phosphate isomerase [Rickettsiales bacterium]
MAFSNKKIIAGNWKMNGLKQEGWRLVEGLLDKFGGPGARPGFEMIVCPPATLLSEVASMVEGSPVRVGAQNCSDMPSGAYTGEISPAMVRDAGASFVILGHSERRACYGETSGLVAAKAALALKHGLTPIVCIGETLEQKDSGRALDVIAEQFGASLPAAATAENVIIAYEPVWAIGTGKAATSRDIIDVHAKIREVSASRLGSPDVSILYGGSVKAANAEDLFALKDVDGVLVGGASLNADEFWAIAMAAE